MTFPDHGQYHGWHGAFTAISEDETHLNRVEVDVVEAVDRDWATVREVVLRMRR